MNRIVIIKFFSVFINVLACLAGAAIVLFHQSWFGAGDTKAFIFWTVPLATALATTGSTITLIPRTKPVIRLLLIFVISVLLSLGWTYCVAALLGPWMRAFSIPVFYLWIGGCAAQLLFLDLLLPIPLSKPKSIRILLALLVFPATLVAVIVIMSQLSHLIFY